MNYLRITTYEKCGKNIKHIFYQPQLTFIDYDSLSNDDIKNYLLTHEYTQNYYNHISNRHTDKLSFNYCLNDINFWELPIMTNVICTETCNDNTSYKLKFCNSEYYTLLVPDCHSSRREKLLFTRSGPWRFQIDLCDLLKFWGKQQFVEALYFPGDIPKKIIIEFQNTNIEIPVTNKYMAMGLIHQAVYYVPTVIRVEPPVDAKVIILHLDVSVHFSSYISNVNNTLEWKCVDGTTIPLKSNNT